MNDSIAGLERLSSAVKKPKELERVLIELRSIFQKTSASSNNLLKSNDDPGKYSLATVVYLRRRSNS